ncbi:hypothetical protein DOD04_10220 [Klebsiella michiganensis]|nr:hypothetical protein [Klebsiella michiganensis]RXI18687.1 hypothetical protein DOD04_10220 [Klebsiella michiganensis]
MNVARKEQRIIQRTLNAWRSLAAMWSASGTRGYPGCKILRAIPGAALDAPYPGYGFPQCVIL